MNYRDSPSGWVVSLSEDEETDVSTNVSTQGNRPEKYFASANTVYGNGPL